MKTFIEPESVTDCWEALDPPLAYLYGFALGAGISANLLMRIMRVHYFAPELTEVLIAQIPVTARLFLASLTDFGSLWAALSSIDNIVYDFEENPFQS